MKCQVVIEDEAGREFAEAVQFYDEREPGLGQRFAREVRAAFRKAANNPERFPLVGRVTRKAKVLDWPYSFYFAIKAEAAQVVISTVWHGKRNPSGLRHRVR